MKSMTGYGVATTETALSLIEVSLRAVNGRYLEVRMHLPREFMAFEADLKKILQKSVLRGTVDVFVGRKFKPGAQTQKVLVNEKLAGEYAKAYKTLAKKLKVKSGLHVESLARWPEVLKLEDSLAATADEKKALLQVMEKACIATNTEREREGKSLVGDLLQILAELEAQVAEINALREEANQGIQSKLEQRLKSRLQGIDIDPARLSQELVFLLEKSDINEELNRLREHLANYKALLQESGSIGKKLDFYTQELLREVNTIGSKSSVSKLTQVVVQAKTLIERLREQVQNVE